MHCNEGGFISFIISIFIRQEQQHRKTKCCRHGSPANKWQRWNEGPYSEAAQATPPRYWIKDFMNKLLKYELLIETVRSPTGEKAASVTAPRT